MIAACLVPFMEHRISRIAWVPEQAFAYHPATDTARMLTTKGHRDYSDLRDGEYPGTPDAYFHDAKARTVYVPDWKMGHGNEAYAEAGRAQGDFNVVMVARAMKAQRAIVYRVQLTPDAVIADQRIFNADDLDCIAADIRAVVDAIPDSEPVPGMHCTESYCPALSICPATLRWQAALVPLRVGSAELTFDPQTPDHFATALEAVKALEGMAEWLKAAIHAKVDALPGEGVDLPDGRRLQRSEKIVRHVDLTAPGAEEHLRAAGLGDAITPSVTFERLRSVIRGAGYRGGEVDTLLDKVIAGLDSIEAIRGEPSVSYDLVGRRAMVAAPRDVSAAFSSGSEHSTANAVISLADSTLKI